MQNASRLTRGLGTLLLALTASASTLRAEETPEVTSAMREQAVGVLQRGLSADRAPVRVHAAEALLWHGHPGEIDKQFASDLTAADPIAAVLYRRVLAQASARSTTRDGVIAPIRKAASTPGDPAQVHALETLAKLKDRALANDPEVRRLAEQGAGPAGGYARWLIANTGNAADLQSLAGLLDSTDATERTIGAYALRHLDKLPPEIAEKLKPALEREPADSPARVYVLGARYVHAPDLEREPLDAELRKFARNGSQGERYEAAAVLAQVGKPAHLPLLSEGLGDEVLDVAIANANALLRIGRRVPPKVYPLDWIVVAGYAFGMLAIGYYYWRRTLTADDYHLGGRTMSSWSVGLSLFATLLSTITYLAVPGEIVQHGPMIMCNLLAYPFIFVVVGWFLIPFIMRYRVTSAYEILENRFGLTVRLLGSSFFLLMRLIWMAVIIYITTSKVLIPLLDWPASSTPYVCAVMGLVTVIYTSMGGLRAVVWTDVVQTAILFGGAILTIVLVSWHLGGATAWWPTEWPTHWPAAEWGYNPAARVTLVGAFVATFTWFICTSGSDQMAIQRYLATRDAAAARRVLGTSLLAGALVTVFLNLLGLSLLAYFTAHPHLAPDAPSVVAGADLFFPQFIVLGLPPGLTGLIVAGLLAAAMSSLSSGLNSSSSVITVDFIDRFRKEKLPESAHVHLSVYVSIVLGIAIVILSSFIGLVPGNLLEITYKTVNLLTAPLFGLFFLAMFVPWATSFGTLVGAMVGLAVVVAINYWEPIFGTKGISFLWAMPVGLAAQIVSGSLASLLPIRFGPMQVRRTDDR